MLNEEHLSVLRRGVGSWNDWHGQHSHADPNLNGADLSGMDLSGINLSRTSLVQANLSETDLGGANLCGATLTGANLSDANFAGTDLSRVNLRDADLRRAILRNADLTMANLTGADLSSTNLDMTNFNFALCSNTVWVNADLGRALGLAKIYHFGPSLIDIETIVKFEVPIPFLRGCGLPESIINDVSSRKRSDQCHSCFVVFSSADEEFALKLHDDLQNRGIRCWLAAHDLAWGAKNLDAINEEMTTHDKLLLVVSKVSLGSKWLANEIGKALAAERSRNQLILMPICIDDDFMTMTDRMEFRDVVDFRGWKDADRYMDSLNRAVAGLTRCER